MTTCFGDGFYWRRRTLPRSRAGERCVSTAAVLARGRAFRGFRAEALRVSHGGLGRVDKYFQGSEALRVTTAAEASSNGV